MDKSVNIDNSKCVLSEKEGKPIWTAPTICKLDIGRTFASPGSGIDASLSALK